MFRVVKGLTYAQPKYWHSSRMLNGSSTLTHYSAGSPFNLLQYPIVTPTPRTGFLYNNNPNWAFHTYLTWAATVSFSDTFVKHDPVTWSDTVSFEDTFSTDFPPTLGIVFKSIPRFIAFNSKARNLNLVSRPRNLVLQSVPRKLVFKAIQRADP
jgi:hypothetical protein